MSYIWADLCSDDVIQRLAPSLAPHRGCTIIDINPGPGIFSSKIHDFLRPRSHILIEPIHEYHAPFLNPLVEAPSSKYHLRDWPFQESVHLDTYIKDGLMENREPGSAQVYKTYAGIDSILVFANLARGRSVRNGNPGHLSSHYRVLSFVNALRHGRGLHLNGPVRMLLWMADKDKNALLPQTVSIRKKIASQLEAYYHVEEIVGGSSRGPPYRERALELESGERVAKRMEAAGIQIPANRQDDLQKEVETNRFAPLRGDSVASSSTSRNWHRELHQLRKAFDQGEFSQLEGGPPGPHETKAKANAKLTPQFLRMRQLRSNARLGDRKQTALEGLLEAEAKIDSLQNELLHMDIDQATREDKLKEQRTIYDELKTALENKEPPFLAKFALLSDDRRALALDPPLLLWDRREAEPLVAQDEEFHTAHKLALLDFRPIVPVQYSMDQELALYFDYLSTHLLFNGSQTMKCLESLDPGAFEALALKVPELQDPRKCGRAFLEDMRTRNLTPELLYKLAIAWTQWPFRTPLTELVDRSSQFFYDDTEFRQFGTSLRRG